MEESVFRKKYQKYKLRVKVWEKNFRKINGRIPSKYDIREASQDIRDSYKMYYKMKTSFLEDTLNDVLSDDGFDIFEMSQRDDDMDVSRTECDNRGPQLPLDITKLVAHNSVPVGIPAKEKVDKKNLSPSFEMTPCADKDVNDFINDRANILMLNDKAWGCNVTKKPETVVREVKNIKSIKPNFKEKLFKNSSFSMRNPRKSLSKSVLHNTVNSSPTNATEKIDSDKNNVLPDLETILLQKAKDQQPGAIIASNPLLVEKKAKEHLKTNVDHGWLHRNTSQNEFEEKLLGKEYKIGEVNNEQNLVERGNKFVYGLTNFDVSNLRAKSIPVNEQTTEKINNLSNLNTNLHFNVENHQALCLQEMVSSEQDKKYEMKSLKEQESDSVVDDSEEESEHQEYRHIIKRRKVFPEVTEIDQTGAPLENTNDNRENVDIVISGDSKQEDLKGDKIKKNKSIAKRKSGKLKTSGKGILSTGKNKATLKEKMNEKTSNRSLKKKANKFEELNEEAIDDKPLNTEDLKYTLVLERSELISTPRVKQIDLDNADKLAQKYISSSALVTGPVASKLKTGKAVDEKRAAAKRKLEEKIAAGKLNENFVTINIQKKSFARFKKNVNYSAYKKKVWKHKRRISALSGPNMDMGGCDGGLLKCFNCGQSGHYASNCKVKGDSLLPLTAQLEDDPSPFPTLEESERMARETVATVHSRNIAKMPHASNAAIYNQEYDNHNDEVKVTTFNTDIEDKILSDKEEMLMETDDELENFNTDAATLESEKYTSPIKKYVGSKIPEEFLKAAGIDPTNPDCNNSTQFRDIGPLYDLNSDGSIKEVTSEVLTVLKMFGHTQFRKGQDRAIMRILSGVSTLVTLSTGSGKSLCYQLPAYLYSKHKKCITLVISPLVSLMEDQVTGVPHFLRAHCLHTNQTPEQKTKIMKMIAEGEVDILLVSPEAVVSGERSTGFGSILRQLPPIAFACIDEAHCVSQWSHNFRPSYLMICKVLKDNLGVKCVLGLTATATLPTRMSIITHLGITDGERGVISDIPLPDNLILSVSKDENRDTALLQLLLSERFEACQSIIIYCTRRDECERIAGYLRTYLQDCKVPEQNNVKKKRKRVNWHAEPYHAGMPPSRRRTVQNAFMNNELRIVVATIAFGMGINKPDIRAVIHYNMPRNFESYVQEVGRAGRDNKTSQCHLFLNANGEDQNELRRHIYANSLDRHVIRKLLQHIFVPCSCNKLLKGGEPNSSRSMNEENAKAHVHLCKGHEIGFSIEKTVTGLDIPEENISTLLCYMELDNRWSINVLSNAYIKAKVISYGGPKYLKHAAKECPPLAMAIAIEIKNGNFKDDSNIIEFCVIDIAAAIGWNSGVVKYQLKNLEWINVNGYTKRSPITVTFYDLGFRIKAPGDFTSEEIDDALDTLYNRSVKQEHTQLIQLQYIFQGLSSVAYNSYASCCSATFSHDRSDQLKGIIRDYFQNDYPKNLKLQVDVNSNVTDAELETDVIALINMYPENNFSGRNIARIFHGISSPNYPALAWHRCKYWRVHSKTDFNRIVHLANNIIVKRRI